MSKSLLTPTRITKTQKHAGLVKEVIFVQVLSTQPKKASRKRENARTHAITPKRKKKKLRRRQRTLLLEKSNWRSLSIRKKWIRSLRHKKLRKRRHKQLQSQEMKPSPRRPQDLVP